MAAHLQSSPEYTKLREEADNLKLLLNEKRKLKKMVPTERKVLAEFKNLDEIFDLCRAGFARTVIADRDVSIKRMHCYAFKGTKCVLCGAKGDTIRLEQWKDGGLHVDLFDTSKEVEVLMTIDHIHPKSLGGSNHLSNYQPMCGPCNWKKGNSLK